MNVNLENAVFLTQLITFLYLSFKGIRKWILKRKRHSKPLLYSYKVPVLIDLGATSNINTTLPIPTKDFHAVIVAICLIGIGLFCLYNSKEESFWFKICSLVTMLMGFVFLRVSMREPKKLKNKNLLYLSYQN